MMRSSLLKGAYYMITFDNYFISTDQLEKHLNDESLRIVDATVLYDPSKDKNDSEYLNSGKPGYLKQHIPGAIFADLFDLNESNAKVPFTFSDSQDFAEKIQELGIGSADTTTIIYDRGALIGADLPSYFWATRLAWQLQMIGVTNIKILDGGFQKWVNEGRPLASGSESYPASDFQVNFNEQLKADDQDLQAAIDDDQILIIDCLSPQQYAGEDSPYGEDKAGHIASSKNIFFAGLGDFESGTLLDPESIKQQFEEIGALNPDKEIITYCGFGIAATWVQYLLQALGQNQVRVYDGSLIDWHSKNLPVEKL